VKHRAAERIAVMFIPESNKPEGQVLCRFRLHRNLTDLNERMV
jgi:hypothetical protein